MNSLIYSNKTQTCALLHTSSDDDTLCVFTEYGSTYPKACEDCVALAENKNANYWYEGGEYYCDCSTEKEEEDEYDY